MLTVTTLVSMVAPELALAQIAGGIRAPRWATAKPAKQAEGLPVAVLELSYAKETPAAVRTQVDQRLRSALARQGCKLIARGNAQVPVGCSAGPCLAKVGRALRAERLLIGGVNATGNSYDLLFTLVDAPSGATLGQVARRCDVCTFAEVGSAVEQASELLLQRAQRVVSAQGRLVIAPPRRGAEVWLDGVPVGRAPLERLVAPGWHRLELRAKRWRQEGRVRVLAGERLRVEEVGPRRSGPQAPATPPPGEVGWPAWLAAGGAFALLTAGAVTLAFDEGCPRGACDDRRDTLVPGLALLGAGAAMTIGAGLLIHYYRSKPAAQTKRASRPGGLTVGISPAGASLVYSRRF